MNETRITSEQNVVAQAVRRALLTAALSAAAISAPGYAAAPAGADELEMVVITGSRIARAETESTNPVQIVTSEHPRAGLAERARYPAGVAGGGYFSPKSPELELLLVR